MELDISEQDPEDMDITDIVLEYEDLASAISILEKRKEELRKRVLGIFNEKNIDVLRVGNVEVKRRKVDWKIWRINKLKPYLMQKDLWNMVEAVDRSTLSKLIDRGVLTEEELKGMYDTEPRYSLHVGTV
jgi:hypothetical protein